ncbi:putative uncharacterized protein DDB_G0292292 [Teleopsis dalmanni]|uniref:putative uncharacterized protein DDB_G0292292 n=1 Tax=Teleopsis dalmanni TaxID=139649 RepID=UPI0018CEFB56|nr:putative uncharacterized protein DDB_G0292292 [Teleopsis dalmanni]
MSCQQATRLITTPSPVIPEDPYVFTDTVSTPPILFNTQKSARARLTDIQIATNGLTLPTRSISSQQKISFAQLNDNLPKTQASLAESLIGTVTQAITPITTTTNVASLKNSSQCQKQIHKVQIKQPLQQQNNIIQSSNLCIIRLQNQSSNQSTQLLQHTPSLWQTPLILDSPPLVSPPTSPASLPSPTASSATITTPPAMGVVTTQAVVTSQATSLPPSNFHHTTVAQHLQKLQCIKNTKKGTAVNNTSKLNTSTEESQQLNTFICVSEPPPLHALEQRKHSDTDLQEVSVKKISSKTESPHEIPQKNLNGNTRASITEKSIQKLKLLDISSISLPAALTVDNKSEVSNSLSAANSCELQQSTQVPKLLQLRKVDETVDTINDQFIEPSIKSQLHQKTNNIAKHNLSSKQNIQNVSSNIVDSKRDILTNEVKKNVPVDTPQNKVSSIQATAKNLKKNYSNEKFANQSQTQTSLGQKKNRKIRVNGFNAKKALSDNHGLSSKKAVTVVRIAEQNTDVDISLLTASYILPYCIQQNCINFDQKKNNSGEHCSAQSGNLAREERILKYKNLLQRQALQLFSVKSMQKNPLHVARQRLLCVDRLLRKYKDVFNEKQTINICSVPSCNDHALDMATNCVKHIVKNPAQPLFSYCSAKLSDNTQCPITVFDIMNDIPLCNEHAHKRGEYTNIANEQRKMSTITLTPQNHRSGPQPEAHISVANNKKLHLSKLTAPRKRKLTLVNPVGRPQKRNKKMQSSAVEPKIVPVSAVLQRKSSTTSLESIASNSHSSNSQLYMPSNSLAPPALAPLSYSGNMISPQRKLNFGTLDANVNDDKKAHDINQIVAQFTMLANKHEANNINHSNGIFNNNNNMNFMNTNSNSNFTSGLFSTSSLPSTDELLTQDMLSMCENSSAYASSEDTGLGGLSESEIIPGPHDDDIPLDDTHLLEENDLDNVLNSLPVDAFNELFTAVRQDECDEVERALALADKHLKSLQQTIGSDSDFLGDFLDVNEDFLNDEDICSNIDTSALFIDSGTNGGSGGGTSGNCSTITDVRGLVQT